MMQDPKAGHQPSPPQIGALASAMTNQYKTTSFPIQPPGGEPVRKNRSGSIPAPVRKDQNQHKTISKPYHFRYPLSEWCQSPQDLRKQLRQKDLQRSSRRGRTQNHIISDTRPPGGVSASLSSTPALDARPSTLDRFVVLGIRVYWPRSERDSWFPLRSPVENQSKPNHTNTK
jgi:hypothetical protein